MILPEDIVVDVDREPRLAALTAAPETFSEWRPRNVVVRVIHYLTNYFVNKVPSFTLRRWWYRRVLGADIDRNALVFLGCFVWFYGPNQIRRSGFRVGPYTRINRNCCLDARGPITIGASVSISPDVHILTTYHLHNEPGFQTESLPVVIDDHVWIGSRATILPGTTIGRGAVVAAGAVARGHIPPFSVVGGVPARPIGTRPERALDYTLDWPAPFFE